MIVRKIHYLHALCILLAFSLLLSCAHASRQRTSSLAEYLFPKDPNRQELSEQGKPFSVEALPLPVRFGLTFIPETKTLSQGTVVGIGRSGYVEPLSEKLKTELMQGIREELGQYSFISSVEVIPTTYLVPGGSYQNLDELRTLTGVDVMTLLSYDQVQFTDEGFAALGYWVTFGAGYYFWPGEKNDTKTMMDAAAYHIPSQRLLFRAVGRSRIEASATPVNLTEALREDSEEGFREALKIMLSNLHEQIRIFQEKVRKAQAPL